MINVLLVQPFFQMWQARMYAIHADEHHVSIFGQIFVLYSLRADSTPLSEWRCWSAEIINLMAGSKVCGRRYCDTP